MDKISASTLFRFVNKLEYLIDIIDNGFHPRHSIEQFMAGKKKFSIAVPMICFCDLRLSQVNKHMNNYGHYGIGMSKGWGKGNGLNPVLYLEEYSLVTENLRKLYLNLYGMPGQDKDSLRPVLLPFIEILRYLKPYEKKYTNKNGQRRSKYYYDEREWRYVPPIGKDTPAILHQEEFADNAKLAKANAKYKNKKLKFSLKNINYLIVDNENEREMLIDHIEKINKYRERDIHLLISKIITAKQIKRDF